MHVRIREMTDEDIPVVAEIERNSFPSPWSEVSFRSELHNPMTRCLVADAGGEITGYICVSVVLDEAHLLTFGVSYLWRRRGVGRALLGHVLDELSRLGVDRLFLEVRRSNRAAINLYRSMGFSEVGVRKRYYSFPREDAIVMMKSLSHGKT